MGGGRKRRKLHQRLCKSTKSTSVGVYKLLTKKTERLRRGKKLSKCTTYSPVHVFVCFKHFLMRV